MKHIITLAITLSFMGPSFGQYSQNLDSMSRKEIRKLILNQDESKKARSLMKSHQGVKGFSIMSYTVGFLSLASGSSPSNDQEVNIGGIYGAMFIGAGLLFTIISERMYYDSVKEYRKVQSTSYTKNYSYIRDSSLVFKTLNK